MKCLRPPRSKVFATATLNTHLQALGFQAVGASGCVVHVAHKGGRVQRVAGCMRQGREGETNQEVS